MRIWVGAAIVAAGLTAASAGFAQAGAPPGPGAPGYPGGVPGAGDPYARPNEMGEKDRVFDRDEQIRRGTQAESDRRAAAGAQGARPAAAGDLKAGAAVADKYGRPLGTIEAVAADGAVVATAAGKVKVPLDAFGKNAKGLLLALTKREFDALVAKANAAPAG
ncbi:MAG: hypothetical protein JO013_05525 [Alphaproteobacteria bacterium]|nr:hypothetical protein [Alphaproteobacteria bacterium]